MSEDNLDQLLKYDPIQVAEDLTGRGRNRKAGDPIAPTETFNNLALLLGVSNNQRKREELQSLGDTHMNMGAEDFRAILLKNGFILDLHEEGGEVGARKWRYQESCEVWYHPCGLLLFFDTFGGKTVNSSKVWYQIKDCDGNLHEVMSSGGWESEDWDNKSCPRYLCGDHDAREALIHKIGKLSIHGEFTNPWPFPNKMHLWLIAYWEIPDQYDINFDYSAISNTRLSRCSEKVRKLVGI